MHHLIGSRFLPREEPATSSWAWSGYRWLTRVAPGETAEMRLWMLSTTTSQSVPIVTGAMASTLSSLAAYAYLGAAWTIWWLAAEWITSLGRLHILKQLGETNDPARRRPLKLTLSVLGLSWATAFGIAAAACTYSGHTAMIALAALNVAGAASIIATRNAATPRYAATATMAVTVPFIGATFVSPLTGMPVAALACLVLMICTISLTRQNNRLLLTTYRAEEHILYLARTDPLSGLLNRQSFQDALSEIEEAEQNLASPISCLCLDLDGFKNVNDRYGHKAGDDLIVAVAQIIRQQVRSIDFVFRMGGDEFTILLPATSPDSAESVAKRLIAALSAPMEIGAGGIIRISASIGGATTVGPPLSIRRTAEIADRNLYIAKRAGKRRYFSERMSSDSPTVAAA